jgi:hypothetical protein
MKNVDDKALALVPRGDRSSLKEHAVSRQAIELRQRRR